MAVDTRHLNLFLPQLISNRELYTNQANIIYGGFNNMGSTGVLIDGVFPLHQSLICDSVQPKTSMNGDSGLTCNMPAPRKRSRDCFDTSQTDFASSHKNRAFSESFLGENIIMPQFQQYQEEIDTVISHHTKKIRMQMEERQRQHSRLIAQAWSESLMKKMKEKDEQFQRMGKLNLILQERVKSLYVESQLWRDLAQSNEAAVNSLRNDLEQVLLTHVGDERFSGGDAAEEDAQSCCGSNSEVEEEEEEEEVEDIIERRTLVEEAQDKAYGRMCRGCGGGEARVLLLPCRHLCLCTGCGSRLPRTCPVCSSNMNATVHVNMSFS